MTKDEAADLLISLGADNLTPKELRSRNAKHRRDKLLAGDQMMIRAMHLTVVPKGTKTTNDIKTAIKVLSS